MKEINWQTQLIEITSKFTNPTFSTSFNLEDQIITDFITRNNLPITIFTIDTGRLFNQSYEIWQKTLDIYNIKISAFYPNQEKIADFVSNNGIDAFYKSKELRQKCCQIRKIEPLKQALKNKDLWISGIRKEHSPSRNQREFLEYDPILKIQKFYPLLQLSEDQLWNYIKTHNVPYNQLYNQNFKSIGCAPCTRAIAKNEDARAGRWWWEEDGKKECGLHK